MKKILRYIGITTIISLSFIISEKTTTVVKDIDQIMTELKEQRKTYIKEPENAIIKDNTIIPGLNGKEIDIDLSYKEMKKIGKFNEKNIIFKQIKPEITINNQYDKYIISGNKTKNTISLIFTVYEYDNIENIRNILNINNIKSTFFIEPKWLEKNNELTQQLIKEGHTIGTLSYNNNYQNSANIWMNNIIKILGKQKYTYCYTEEENETNLKSCAIQKSYTIKPNIITKKEPLIEIKKNITSGSLIAMPINKETNEQLELIIKYIKTKGYNIENIQTHLSEKNDN